MRIDQDTFKEGKLNFGPRYSSQRDTLHQWRWEQFRDLFELNYPEYVMVMYGMKESKITKVLINLKKSTFKMKDKLAYGLSYGDMELVNTNEFAKIIRKFKNYLRQTQNDGVVEKLFRFD